jgi:fused signal recognition particle receptor
MFNFIKDALKKVYSQVTSNLHALFGQSHVDEATLKELETLLISADTGVKTTKKIIDNLKQQARQGNLNDGTQLHTALKEQLLHLLASKPADLVADVYLLVGINGSGKTTFSGKLAYHLHAHNNRVMLVAADTFRAAAVEQLTIWAQRTNSQLITGKPNQEPASVVFAGCEQFNKENCNKLIIDTAGRLQTKTNLMQELAKVKRIIERQLPNKKTCTLLTVDAMLGQNSFEQAKLFHECIALDGVVLTKMDGTGKGGIVFSITQELGIPIAYLSFGEQLEQLKPFDAGEYVTQLLQ